MTDLSSDTVADVLARSTRTAGVFVSRRMACVGCTMAPFVTVAEAARSYGIDPDRLAADLERVIAAVANKEPSDGS